MKRTEASKKRLTVVVVGFLVVMLSFTVLSRAIASFSVVSVETATVASKRIEKVIEASATTQALQEVAVSTESELIVEALYVTAGDVVESGEALFKVRKDELSETIIRCEEDQWLAQLRISQLSSLIENARVSSMEIESLEGTSQNFDSDSSVEEFKVQLSSAIVERDRLGRSLESLYALAETDGVVYAPTGGIISDILVQVGDLTSQNAVLLIADSSMGSKLVFSVDSVSAGFFTENATPVVTDYATKEIIANVEVVSVARNLLSQDLVDVTLYLPAESVPIGTLLEIRLVVDDEIYDQCIPLSAIHQTSSGAYVYVVEEVNTVLGAEQIVRMVLVTVEAQDNFWAAVGGLGTDNQVIINSDKVLTEKDRVTVR